MRAVAFVEQVLWALEGQIHRARLKCVAKVVVAMLAVRRVRLTSVARAMSGTTKHDIKSLDRLIGSRHLAAEVGLFQRFFVRQLSSDERLVLLADWTDIGTMWTAFVVTAVVEGRGLTLLWDVQPRSKSNSPWVEGAVLKKLAALLAPGSRPVIITDAGFRGPWMKRVVSQGWSFVSRVRGRVLLREEGQAWCPVKDVWESLTTRPKDIGPRHLGRQSPVSVRLVGVWRRKASRGKRPPDVGRREKRRFAEAYEPWVLATSLTDLSASDVVRLYSLRMRIEETFRDQKCLRFGVGLDDVQTRQPARIAVYVLLAVLAHFIAMMTGAAAESVNLHRAFQANTVERRVLSWARLGAELLRRAVSIPDDAFQHFLGFTLGFAALR